MPRQDVPYGGAICRLKERIAEIWDKLDQKLHSINGVEGDGAGNVNIVSGDAAITVSESPTGHFIEIGLDHGNLPSAAVSSVNGQTGEVRLDAADIPSDGNSNVQSDIAANKAAINDCFDSITSEQAARQSADATLQTNINAVSASIPDMSVTPDIYKGVKRDSQGRAFAADPAAGATDKTLVTANWVSQTGAGAPNNLVHRNGDEDIDGIKNFTGSRMRLSAPIPYLECYGTYIAGTPNQYEGFFQIRDVNGVEIGDLYFSTDSNGNSQLSVALRKADGSTITKMIATSAS